MAVTDVVVVDTSLVVKWLIDEDDYVPARALASEWLKQGTRVAAPHLLLAELTNALHRRVSRDELTVAEAAPLIETVLVGRLELHHDPQLYRRALDIASQLEQGASYDSLYLALAESLDCEYWTADNRFFRAARGRYPQIRLLTDVDALA